MDSEAKLRAILQAEPPELSEILLEGDIPPPLARYARALLAYRQGRVEELTSELESMFMDGAHDPRVACLIRLRIAIRRHEVVDLNLPNIPDESGLWAAETKFVVAMALETQGRDLEARDHYREARKLFHLHQAPRKAAKSFHNSIAAESRLTPARRLIPEYQEAARLAREAGDWPTVAAALNNLSREFQLLRAPRVALRHASEAIDILRERAHGTYSFYTALCHRAHLQLELGHEKLAATDFEEASASELPEIRASLEVLRKWFDQAACEIYSQPELLPTPTLLPTWKEREKSALGSAKDELSELEGKLISALAEGPKDRHELIAALWGNQEDFFHLENRLKQLLHRLRRKTGNWVGFAEGRYYLTDEATG